MAKVLVACEYSGRVRQAFRLLGHDAWSCDLYEPAEDGSPWHRAGDAERIAYEGGWDLMIAHPPCTHLAVSGARWATDHWVTSKKHTDGRYWHDGAAKRAEQAGAIDFVQKLLDAPIRHIALENPISIISSRIRRPDQIIQPWMFGHGEVKATCLWLKNLPKLGASSIAEGREARVHNMPPGPDRWKDRSRTFQGVADAMAQQWSLLLA